MKYRTILFLLLYLLISCETTKKTSLQDIKNSLDTINITISNIPEIKLDTLNVNIVDEISFDTINVNIINNDVLTDSLITYGKIIREISDKVERCLNKPEFKTHPKMTTIITGDAISRNKVINFINNYDDDCNKEGEKRAPSNRPQIKTSLSDDANTIFVNYEHFFPEPETDKNSKKSATQITEEYKFKIVGEYYNKEIASFLEYFIERTNAFVDAIGTENTEILTILIGYGDSVNVLERTIYKEGCKTIPKLKYVSLNEGQLSYSKEYVEKITPIVNREEIAFLRIACVYSKISSIKGTKSGKTNLFTFVNENVKDIEFRKAIIQMEIRNIKTIQ